MNRFGKSRPDSESFSDHRRRFDAQRQVEESGKEDADALDHTLSSATGASSSFIP
jgi:hypothetical protein